MGRPADGERPASGASLTLRHPGAAERRINVKRVAGDAVTHAPTLAIQQVGGDDFEVVVGGMCEGTAAVAIAERPNAGNVGSEPVVNLDVPARVRLDASRFETEVVGVRSAPHCKQDVRADRRGLAFFTVESNLDALLVLRQTDALRAGADVDTLGHSSPT